MVYATVGTGASNGRRMWTCDEGIVEGTIPRHAPALDVRTIGPSGNEITVISQNVTTRTALVDAPVLVHFVRGRLDVAIFICATRLQHSLLSVPIPLKVEPGVRAPMYWFLKLRVLPGVASVGGYFDLADGASAGPGQAGNIVETGAGEPVSG